MTRLKVGYAFRTAADARCEIAMPPLSLMPVDYLTPAMQDRAVAVQLLLADQGQHRAPSILDLLVAAAAELAGLTGLAVGNDFGLIAEITGRHRKGLRLLTEDLGGSPVVTGVGDR